MRSGYYLILLLFVNSYCKIDDKIIDSISIELAYGMRMNPYTPIYLNIKDKDKICNQSMLKYSNKLIISLKTYCKNVIVGDTIEDYLIWSIIPKENNLEEFSLSVEIMKNGSTIFNTRKYDIGKYLQLSDSQLEKIKFRDYAYKKLESLNIYNQISNYKVLKSERVIEYQLEILKEILRIGYNIKFYKNSENTVSFNLLGDLILQTNNNKFVINGFFSLNKITANKKILYCFLSENGLIVKKLMPDSLIGNNDILKRENVLYPSTGNDSSSKYYWKNKDSFLGYFSSNGICDLTYSEKPIAIVNDITDNNRMWKISLIGFRTISSSGNIVNSFSLYSVRDFFEYRQEVSVGKNNFYFQNYFTKKDESFEKIVENTNRDITINFINRIGGIHWNTKEIILNLILEDILNRKKGYGTI